MSEEIGTVVTNALGKLPPERRAEFLRKLMATAAAGLTALEGHEASAEAAYQLADSIASGKPIHALQGRSSNQ